MPVYVRQNVAFTPPSLAEPPDEDLDIQDFLQDPDQMRDNLPQPFRMLDKILNNLVDAAWEIISARKEEQIREESRIRAPQYECGNSLENLGNARCIEATPDGKFVVVGLSDGLAVVNSEDPQISAMWREGNTEIVSVQTSILSDKIYMISALDDMGIARLFACAEDNIYVLTTLNEQEGEKKLIAHKCEASSLADFVGVSLESPSSHESWLEIHKLPKDIWLKELETALAKSSSTKDLIQTQTPRQHSPPPADGEEQGENAELTDEALVNKNLLQDDADKASNTSRSQSPSSQHEAIEKIQTVKFTATNLVLRVREPTAPSGVSWSSAHQLAKTIDSSGDVIGMGNNHQVSSQHLEMRQMMFDTLHEQLKPYKSEDETFVPPQANLHFLHGGRMLPHGLDHNVITGQLSSVAVWWEGHGMLCHYNLTKTAKDLEHKPDLVWPVSDTIVASAVTPCTSFLALALKNNNIVVWDKRMGIPRRIAHVMDKGQIKSIHFMDPCLCPQDNDRHPTYRLATRCQLMAVGTSGQVYILNCGMADKDPPMFINLNIEKPIEQPTMVKLLPGLPELIMTCRQNGQLFLQDIQRDGEQLCEITLPDAHEISSPWQPVVVSAAKGQLVFVRGTKTVAPAPEEEKQESEEPEKEQEQPRQLSSLFIFSLDSVPSLETYRTRTHQEVPYMVHSTVEDRIDALFSERLSLQALRQPRMQARWTQLKSELKLIQKIRNDHERKSPAVDDLYAALTSNY